MQKGATRCDKLRPKTLEIGPSHPIAALRSMCVCCCVAGAQPQQTETGGELYYCRVAKGQCREGSAEHDSRAQAGTVEAALHYSNATKPCSLLPKTILVLQRKPSTIKQTRSEPALMKEDN